MKRKLVYALLFTLVLVVAFICYFVSVASIDPPTPASKECLKWERKRVGYQFYTLGNSWIKKSNCGLWEMYIESEDPFERGTINGKLAKDLAQLQEVYFIKQIKKIIPSEIYLNYLKYAVAWFNRDLENHISEEYKQEIYGVSNALNNEFDFIGSKYQRSLNYHAAHDIGHALQDKNMVVGCTSFSAWNSKSYDNSLIIGRNFDFFVGDDFAKDKIVCFYNPIHGNKFVFITWGGFVGAVSGMNEKGLSITINASKSDIPTGSATPISLVAREILQYASNIDEAMKIAESRKTFVSESILVGSAYDKKAVIIEKSPNKISCLESPQNYIICANNFQSKDFENDPINIRNKAESSSTYRYARMNELLQQYPKIGPAEVAKILRNQKGLKDKCIGMSNEKSLNQLIAHHAVIMQPSKGLIWVSTAPYQLGKFICYDLQKIFKSYRGLKQKIEIYESQRTIPEDDFLMSSDYKNFILFKTLKQYVKDCTKNSWSLSAEHEKKFIESNPEYYEVYDVLGNYFESKSKYKRALEFYKMALQKEIPVQKETDRINEHLKKCQEKTQD